MEIDKGFKQTDLGVLPRGWECPSIADLKIEVGDGIHSTPNYESNGEYYFINGNNLHKGKVIVDESTKRISFSEFKRYGKPLKGDRTLLLSINGTIGNVAFYKNEPVLLGKSAAYLNTSGGCSRSYLYYALQSKAVEKQFEDGLTGSTIKNLGLGTIRQTKVPLPLNCHEQNSIANALSDADAYIESIERLIAKKRLIKKGVMLELLTGKRRLAGFKKNWEDVILGDQANFYKGKGLPKSALAESGKYPCIHYGELFTQYKEVIKSFRSRTDQSGDTFLSQVNDVLMPTSDVTPKGLAKASCITQENVILGGDILVIRTSKKLSGSFLSYIIRFLDTQILQLVSGTTVFHIYASDMARFKFSMPEIDEQNAIVEILEDFEREIEFLENKLHKANHIKQGMMAELLTGRIRLV